MCRRRTQSLILPNQDDSYKVGNKEGSHLQLCLLHNVVIDTVSDKQVNKHNVGGVDEGNVLKVKVRVERLKTNVLQVKVKVKCLKNQEEK